MTKQQIDDVMLASEDCDFGLVHGGDAHKQAQQFADEEGVAITIRNPVTDEVLVVIEPITRLGTVSVKVVSGTQLAIP